MTSLPPDKRQSIPDFKSGQTNFISKKPVRNRQTLTVNTLLRTEIAHLWPTIANSTACQQACAAVLPQLFLYCQVMHLEADQLTIAAPNSALASKLKQQLPKLQDTLQKAGWQINAIRIKVQVNPIPMETQAEKQCQLPGRALQAFTELERNLAGTKGNTALIDALRALITRPR